MSQCGGSKTRAMMFVWSVVYVILLGTSLGLAKSPGDNIKPDISVRFACDHGPFLFPTFNQRPVCDGNLQMIFRNHDKSKAFPGSTGIVFYQNSGCSNNIRKSDTAVSSKIDVPLIEADDFVEMSVSSLLRTPEGVTCEPGCLKLAVVLNRRNTIVARREVLPDNEDCHLPDDGSIQLKVDLAGSNDMLMVDAKSDFDGDYYVNLHDFVSKITLEGTLPSKIDENGDYLMYRTLVFLRNKDQRHSGLGWPINCENMERLSPEAIFGDPTFEEFLVPQVKGQNVIFDSVKKRVYITGTVSACPGLVCGHSELVIYFDWMHHLPNYPRFDKEKCDNFKVIPVFINCSSIPFMDIQKTQVVKVVPDVTSSGTKAYAMSCNGNHVQFNQFNALHKVWRAMDRFWNHNARSAAVLMGMKRVEQLLKSKLQNPQEICQKANKLDGLLDSQSEDESDNCKAKFIELYDAMRDCDDDEECLGGPTCCSSHESLINDTLLACEGTRVGRALQEWQDYDEEGGASSVGDAEKMDCPREESFEIDEPLADAEHFKALLDDMDEGQGLGYHNCSAYPSEPEVCAQRLVTHMLHSPMSKYWNYDINANMSWLFHHVAKDRQNMKGSKASLEYLKHCDFPEVTKTRKVKEPHYYAVSEMTPELGSGIWRSRRNTLGNLDYCWDLVAFHRCPSCESSMNMAIQFDDSQSSAWSGGPYGGTDGFAATTAPTF